MVNYFFTLHIVDSGKQRSSAVFIPNEFRFPSNDFGMDFFEIYSSYFDPPTQYVSNNRPIKSFSKAKTFMLRKLKALVNTYSRWNSMSDRQYNINKLKFIGRIITHDNELHPFSGAYVKKPSIMPSTSILFTVYYDGTIIKRSKNGYISLQPVLHFFPDYKKIIKSEYQDNYTDFCNQALPLP